MVTAEAGGVMNVIIFGLIIALIIAIGGILLQQSRRDAMKHSKDANDQLIQHNAHLIQWNDYLLKHWDDSLKEQVEKFTDSMADMEIKLTRSVGDAAAEVFDTVHGDRTMHVTTAGKSIPIKAHKDVDDPETTRVEPPKEEA
jgi:uncharacterized protein HemX